MGRMEEIEAIRRGFALHLGESLYEQAKDMPELVAGRERLFEGIALCDAELARLRMGTCPVCGQPVEPTHKYCVSCGAALR